MTIAAQAQVILFLPRFDLFTCSCVQLFFSGDFPPFFEVSSFLFLVFRYPQYLEQLHLFLFDLFYGLFIGF